MRKIEIDSSVQIKPGFNDAGTVFRVTKIWINSDNGRVFVEGVTSIFGVYVSVPATDIEPKREWHGCTNPEGHDFEEGICQESDCGTDLKSAQKS